MRSFFEGRRILVTGGTGFVGSHFAEVLRDLGAHVRIPVHRSPPRLTGLEAIQADIADKDCCRELCQDMEMVVHAAGSVGAAGTGSFRTMTGISCNLAFTANILEACWMCNVSKALVFSSSTVYPNTEKMMTEEDAESEDIYTGYYGYGWMRRYFEKLAAFVTRESDTVVNVVRPTAVYGEYGNFRAGQAQVVHALIRRACAKESPFAVWGTDEVTRDFLHIRDLVHGALLVLLKSPSCAPINIGSGESTTIRELASTVLSLCGQDHTPLVFDESKPVTIPCRRVSIARAREELGFAPRLTLRQGLERTITWYLSHGDRRRCVATCTSDTTPT